MSLFHLFLPEASSIASSIDALFWSMVALCALVALAVIAAIVFYGIRYRRGMPMIAAAVTPRTWASSSPGSWCRSHCSWRLSSGVCRCSHWRARRRRMRAQSTSSPSSGCGRSAPRRPARDQHAARAVRRAGPPHHDLAGRDPLLLRPGFPAQAGRPAGALCPALVPADPARDLPLFCTAVLRHGPFGDGRLRRRHEPGRLCAPGSTRSAPAGRLARAGRRCSAASAAAAATARMRPVHAPDPRRALRTPGSPCPTAPRARRRRYIRDRILFRKQIAAGYRADHALLQGQVSDEELLALTAYINSLSPSASGRRSCR